MQITAAIIFSIATLSAGAFAAPAADQAATAPAEAGQDVTSFEADCDLNSGLSSGFRHGHSGDGVFGDEVTFGHGNSLGTNTDSFASRRHGNNHFGNSFDGVGHLGSLNGGAGSLNGVADFSNDGSTGENFAVDGSNDNISGDFGHHGHTYGHHGHTYGNGFSNFGSNSLGSSNQGSNSFGSDLFDNTNNNEHHSSNYNHHGQNNEGRRAHDNRGDSNAASYREDPARSADSHHQDQANDNHRETLAHSEHGHDELDAGSSQQNARLSELERERREHDNKSEYELGFGYKRGSKYDNGYGYSRGYDYGRDRKADEARAENRQNAAERRPQRSHDDGFARSEGERDAHNRNHYDDAHANRERGRNSDTAEEHRRNRGQSGHSDEGFARNGGSFSNYGGF